MVGDAALTVNPITSQGVSLALEDALTLAVVTRQTFRRNDLRAHALRPYELWRRRRPKRYRSSATSRCGAKPAAVECCPP